MNNYRYQQSDNTLRFKQLTKSQKARIKSLGYHNKGWSNVLKSKELLDDILELNLLGLKTKKPKRRSKKNR